jgi:SAM-dependent methyltransferase
MEDRMSDVTEIVRERYGRAAQEVRTGAKAGCCGNGGGCGTVDPITSNLYATEETQWLPTEAVLGSLGCGNPTALAELKPGETVLDLGSGGGIDVLLSARRVGPSGKVYGLDMTDEMLALARENQRKAGVENVEFLKGQIERMPLPDNSVDVIISNCVINLSADKDRVLEEAFRVLRPGGRFAVSDIVTCGPLPAEAQQSMALWTGCVAGALEEGQYVAKLKRAGFVDVSVEPTRVYDAEDARGFLSGSGLDTEAIAKQVDGKVMSAFIRAAKPTSPRGCCGPDCCGGAA